MFKNRGVVLPWVLVTALPGKVCCCVDWTKLFWTVSISFLCSFVSRALVLWHISWHDLFGSLTRVQLEPFVVVSLQNFAFVHECFYFRWMLLFLAIALLCSCVLYSKSVLIASIAYRVWEIRKLISTPNSLVSLRWRYLQERRAFTWIFFY